jgi:Tfp pilus assembly protein PilX
MVPSMKTEDQTMSDLPEAKTQPSKSERVAQLLSRKAGADLAALREATGWQPHSVRAALSGLRKAGYSIERLPAKTPAGGSVYRITARPERRA